MIVELTVRGLLLILYPGSTLTRLAHVWQNAAAACGARQVYKNSSTKVLRFSLVVFDSKFFKAGNLFSGPHFDQTAQCYRCGNNFSNHETHAPGWFFYLSLQYPSF